MRAGSARHLQLEVECAPPVAVAAATREDLLALRLLNSAAALARLVHSRWHMVREVYVFGRVAGQAARQHGGGAGSEVWVTGVIDELQVLLPAGLGCGGGGGGRNAGDGGGGACSACGGAAGYHAGGVHGSGVCRTCESKVSPGAPYIALVEHKTSASRSPPSMAKLQGARLQLLLYHSLLQGLHTASSAGECPGFFQAQGVQADMPLSPELAAWAQEVRALLPGGAGAGGCGALGGSHSNPNSGCGGATPCTAAGGDAGATCASDSSCGPWVLRDVMALLHCASAHLPPVHDTLVASYEAQGSGAALYTDTFPADEQASDWLGRRLAMQLALWQGLTTPTRCRDEDATSKCAHCPFRAPCESVRHRVDEDLW